MRLLERLLTEKKLQRSIDGSLALPSTLFSQFLSSPYDVMPDFKAPPGFKPKNGRGKDHPRYGRFIYAFSKHFKPEIVVEVGTYAGGTSVGWARAIAENAGGKLICVDNDSKKIEGPTRWPQSRFILIFPCIASSRVGRANLSGYGFG